MAPPVITVQKFLISALSRKKKGSRCKKNLFLSRNPLISLHHVTTSGGIITCKAYP